MKALFWLSLFAIAYPYAVYPLLLVALNRLTGRQFPTPEPDHRPTVSVIMPVHNEASRIAAKVQNLLETDYAVDRLQLIVKAPTCLSAKSNTKRSTARASFASTGRRFATASARSRTAS